MTRKELIEEAKKLKLNNYSKLNKAELEEMLEMAKMKVLDLDKTTCEDLLYGFAEVLSYEDENDWYELRNKGIGGSDIGAILGQNKWKSSIDVYLDKIGQGKKFSNNFTHWGKTLEEVIRKDFAKNHPEYYVYSVPFTFRSIFKDYFLANVDGLYFDKEKKEWGILEIKTTSEWSLKDWEEEIIPQSYYLQIQWYLMVTGLKVAKIYTLIGGNKTKEFTVERADEKEILYMKKAAVNFWEENVLKEIPPMPDGTDSYMEYLKEKAENIINTEAIELSNLIDDKAEAIKDIDKQMKELKTASDKLKQEIMLEMIDQDTTKAKTENHKYSIVTTIRNSLDSKKIKEKYPEIAKEFSKTSTSKFIRIS